VGSRAENATSLLDEALMLYIRSTAGVPGNVPTDCPAAADAARLLQRVLDSDSVSPEVEAVTTRTLACLLDVGAGVPKDEDRAAELWKIAASAGDAGAQYHLAMRCPPGDAAATELLEKAVTQDHIPAHVALAAKYDAGDGVKQDQAKAAKLLQHASQHGHPNALYSLGVKHEKGDGVKLDKKAAFGFLQGAAARGHAAAMFRLGALYNQGEGVAQDKKKAAELWEKAAIQGNVPAQYNLGIKFYTGDGVEQDFSLAEKLWEMAAVNGHEDAIHNLAALRSGGA